MVKILFFATIRDYTQEKESSVDGASSIRELLLLLSGRYGAPFQAEVLEGDNISDRVIVLVNGKHIAHTGGQETPLKDGDTVAIFPIIGGG
jgi:MoaD family protein